MKITLVCALLSALFACGGRVEEPKSGGSGGEDTAPASSASSDGAGNSGSDGSFPAHDLGDCKPGFDRAKSPARSCNWLTESGLCFETKDDACACICPAVANSVCYSSFYDGDGSATLVHCI